jgi:pimeloyl-ACP methyl ester carboxylesterase
MHITRIGRAFKFIAPLFCLLTAFGCYYPAPKVPLDTLRYDAPGGDRKQLIVFLPGNGDPLTVFDENGMVAAVRARNLPVDIIAVDAHIGYYMTGSILARLKQDVIDPARGRGYRRIWLVGNSLGGYGSISYARQYPQDIFGIVLLGPFLGDKNIIREIREAGGLQKWDPGQIPENTRATWEKELWKWLKDGDQQKGFWHWVKSCDEPDEDCPSRIYLGFGKRDRFSSGQKLLAEGLSPENVIVIDDGGHDWDTWKQAWDLALDRMTAKRPAGKIPPAAALPRTGGHRAGTGYP